ncbi:hypothetical protein V1523DRAFT_448792 [Lipomyces doorenjongii]
MLQTRSSFALKTGSKTLFFANSSLSWNTYLFDPQKVSTTTPLHTVCESPDIRLVNVWLDHREFTTAVNLGQQTQRKHLPGLFQEALISIQYRLQHLAYDDHSRHEVRQPRADLHKATIKCVEDPICATIYCGYDVNYGDWMLTKPRGCNWGNRSAAAKCT